MSGMKMLQSGLTSAHLSPHSLFILAHDTSRGILQPVIASINALLVNTV